LGLLSEDRVVDTARLYTSAIELLKPDATENEGDQCVRRRGFFGPVEMPL
jgi:hypothetical protein